ncbi:hypothetical protein BJX61DRAFT_540785 [Aspergillus egyptiacus]|nr:hypothetical protein BJX61DRAFT_540785 [Aspergillus egyptiacus]
MAYPTPGYGWRAPAVESSRLQPPRKQYDDGMYHEYYNYPGFAGRWGKAVAQGANTPAADSWSGADVAVDTAAWTANGPSPTDTQSGGSESAMTAYMPPVYATEATSVTTSETTTTSTTSTTTDPSSTSKQADGSATASPSGSAAAVENESHRASGTSEAALAVGVITLTFILLGFICWRLRRRQRALQAMIHGQEPEQAPGGPDGISHTPPNMYNKSAGTLVSISEKLKPSMQPRRSVFTGDGRMGNTSTDHLQLPLPASSAKSPGAASRAADHAYSALTATANKVSNQVRQLVTVQQPVPERRSRMSFENGFFHEHIPAPPEKRQLNTLQTLCANSLSKVQTAVDKLKPQPSEERGSLPESSTLTSFTDYSNDLEQRHEQEQLEYQQQPQKQPPAPQSQAEQPPAQQPPALQSLVEEPLVEQLPAQQSQAQHSQAQQSPQQEPPAQQPPAQKSREQQSPAEQSPTEQPQAEQSPAEQSPAQQPQHSPALESKSSVVSRAGTGKYSINASSETLAPGSSAENEQPAHSPRSDKPPSPGPPSKTPSVKLLTLQLYQIDMSFTPRSTGQLNVTEGQIVKLEQAYDDGWAMCTLTDARLQGLIPRACLSSWPVKICRMDTLHGSNAADSARTQRRPSPVSSVSAPDSQPSRFYRQATGSGPSSPRCESPISPL